MPDRGGGNPHVGRRGAAYPQSAPRPPPRRPVPADAGRVRSPLQCLLDANEGVVTRAQLMAGVPHHVVDRGVAGGHLIRVLPQVYVSSSVVDQLRARLLAALRYAGPNAALSHTSGLWAWGLVVPVPPDAPLHVMTDGRQLRADPLVVVHRHRGFRAEPPMVVERQGLPVVRLESCLVDSWPLLDGPDRRAPLIHAVQQRLTLPDRILEVAAGAPALRGRAQLMSLLDLLAAGCHSELEIWGFRQVFDHPALPPSTRQLRVQLAGRRAYLDVAYEREKVDVELDGSRYHGGVRREGDTRRDVALAVLGWLVLRYSHMRLHEEPDAVRREVLATLEVRRRQQGIAY